MEEHFATLRLLDSDTDNKLTKAFSYSELPSSQQLCMQQSYHSGNPSGLVRQYSCEQIFDATANTRKLKISEVVLSQTNECRKEWQTTVPYPNAFHMPKWQFCSDTKIIHSPNLTSNAATNEIEYMEVENAETSKESIFSSSNLPVNIDTIDKSEPESEQLDDTKIKDQHSYADVKKNLRPLMSKAKAPVKKKTNMCCWNLLYVGIIPIVIGTIALILNPVTYTVCNRAIMFSNATLELQRNLYGQEDATSNIVNALQNDINHLKFICLIGGTGIGKSYTAEIIITNFPLKKKIFVHDMALEHSVDEKVLNSINSYELIIIENLKIKDFDVFLNMIDILNKNSNKCITIFAIVNVENVNKDLTRDADLTKSATEINRGFSDKLIDVSVIPYQPLNEQALKMCIMNVAKQSDLILSEDQMNEIMQNLILSGSGCKGAYAKVQVIGRE
ncbi:PREDICTED: uncharacterized protein LOC107186475 [Dufourea novaeangliae]|uniref:Uncharacterized protein n=1 Tax=Dufourea novaeangliae TaxID=178035 RepID=A0A154P971_DUFNO|nr:PREDICTED: uncharacterized protein LOC107186475 [Dufourea novaeangliae]KZC08377.1 hypothetical protein WN55_09281 [Dufourea novaeangliae]